MIGHFGKGGLLTAKSRLGGLGKGLDALFVDNNNASDNQSVTLGIHEIEPNKDQPRKHFDEEALAELADSIREHGILQPLLVRPMPNGRYQLIAGERRWRASRMAGLTQLPVVIREMTDTEATELALIENLQREDLNPVEEALGYRQLMDNFGMTQEKVAASVGKSRPAVANALRLLHLPDPVLFMVQRGEVSAGHAKALLSLEDEALILENAEKICKDRVTVREIEILAKNRKKPAAKEKEDQRVEFDPDRTYCCEVELALSNELGRKVQIKPSAKEGGTIVMEFFSKEDLAAIAQKLGDEAPKLPELQESNA